MLGENGEEIFPDVTAWLAAADKDIQDADTLIQGIAEAMKKCFFGICPNLMTRCQLGKKAHEKSSAVGKLLQPTDPCTHSSGVLPSRVPVLNQIVDALKDPELNLIGVYGMGGVGKSTLAEQVRARAARETTVFGKVVKVEVSQSPDLKRIQGEIAESLQLKLDAQEIPGRAHLLRQSLEEAKVLIIFDNLWKSLT